MKDQIKGEESSHFVNALGEEVIIEVTDSPADCTNRLNIALEGRLQLAEKLTQIIYEDKNVAAIDNKEHRDKLKGVEIDPGRLGIWVDPIGQYH